MSQETKAAQGFVRGTSGTQVPAARTPRMSSNGEAVNVWRHVAAKHMNACQLMRCLQQVMEGKRPSENGGWLTT